MPTRHWRSAVAALTMSAAESVALATTIKLDGGTLTDALGITVASGALTGFGKVNANIPPAQARSRRLAGRWS